MTTLNLAKIQTYFNLRKRMKAPRDKELRLMINQIINQPKTQEQYLK